MLKALTKDMTAEDLRKNMLSTYFTLRVGIVILSAALPVGLLVYSVASHGGLQEHSMSAFYGAYGGVVPETIGGGPRAVWRRSLPPPILPPPPVPGPDFAGL